MLRYIVSSEYRLEIGTIHIDISDPWGRPYANQPFRVLSVSNVNAWIDAHLHYASRKELCDLVQYIGRYFYLVVVD